MGIFCKIGVAEPKNEFTPGSVVSGTIKYAFDKNTVVKRIVMSLKGRGRLQITTYTGSGSNQVHSTFEKSEEYVSIENVMLNDDGGKSYQHGEYDIPFTYDLPENIPGSFKYHKYSGEEITCKIAYFVKIKFEVAGFLKFDKRFEKEIKVVPALKPNLPMEPVIYGERKQFFQPFKTKKALIHLKACIKCSVLEPGGKVEIAYELLNDTKKTVEAIESKIVTIYKFHYDEKSHEKKTEDVKNTQSKTSAVKSGETVESPLEIEIPSDIYCINDSKLVSREYAVAITVILPVPHNNVRLLIPIQVGKTSAMHPVSNSPVELGSPPSYWEAMNVANENGTLFGDKFFDDVKK